MQTKQPYRTTDIDPASFDPTSKKLHRVVINSAGNVSVKPRNFAQRKQGRLLLENTVAMSQLRYATSFNGSGRGFSG